MATYRSRLKEFEEVLNVDVIDLTKLRELCFNGIPDEQGLRPLCWKILLNYLPIVRETWPTFLDKQRNLYSQFIEEMIVNSGDKDYTSTRTDVTLEDHPLNPNPDSQWLIFFKDNEVLVQVDKDVRRLCPDISFFQRATEFPRKELLKAAHGLETLRKRIDFSMLKAETVTKNRMGTTNLISSRKMSVSEYQTLPEGQEAHWEVVERILFLYAKLNPGQGYVQGMNEIIGPIYYTFASDMCKEWREYAEADSFFVFTNLMSEIRDNFIKSLDDSACGIGNKMKQLMEMVKQQDMCLWLQLEKQDLKPQFYSFRWLTLLLSQEFPLPDVIRVWDSLFSDSHRFDFLICVCCAMLMLLRNDLVQGDFSSNMKLLQNFPLMDISLVLSKAVCIRS